jgi:16S rRNA (guanine(966)-N(2))-methyltransferase RsmD
MQKTRRPQAKASARPQKSAHQVRIIGGQWKRTPLPVLDAEGLRPTPDRVRETVFNWLHHLLGGDWERVRCLDLFAGTGALGFEAASRGAAHVLMVESSVPAVKQLDATRIRLKSDHVAVRRGDARVVAQQLAGHAAGGGRFEVIFLDPPYHQGWLPAMMPLCESLLADGGVVYAETEAPIDADAPPAWLAGWTVVRADKAGMVCFHLLQRNSDAGIQA